VRVFGAGEESEGRAEVGFVPKDVVFGGFDAPGLRMCGLGREVPQHAAAGAAPVEHAVAGFDAHPMVAENVTERIGHARAGFEVGRILLVVIHAQRGRRQRQTARVRRRHEVGPVEGVAIGIAATGGRHVHL
jgi:hypothetical protein